MRRKHSVDDYTPEEVTHFDYMMEVIDAYNKLMEDEDIDSNQIDLNYSEIEIMELSQYRELLLAKEVRDFMGDTATNVE